MSSRKFVLIATAATLTAASVWLTRTPSVPAPDRPAAAPASAQQPPAPLPQPAAVAVRSETLPVQADLAPTRENLPSEQARWKMFAQARVVLERATPPDATGRYERRRILETAGKYRHTRVEETWQQDPAGGEPRLLRTVAMAAEHVVTRLAEGQSVATLEEYLRSIGGSILRVVPRSAFVLVRVPSLEFEAFDRQLALLRAGGSPTRYAEPDFLVNAFDLPNDPSFGQLWGLHNTGQTGGRSDADVDAPEAWEITRGSASVVVGVIDTGIDHLHPDLAANIWYNAGEIPGNGIDDDGNGYIDDVRGWNFVNDNNNPSDDHYHGTHVAGTIGAIGGNGVGVIGVSPVVRLMSLKFLSSSGGGYTSDAVEAVLYATANGATLTSNSWGGGGYSQALKDSIDAARAAGLLFVAAAGNDSSNNDIYPTYPASYTSANIISVAATDHNDTLASFSNYGATSVHLAAPGVSVFSTAPNGSYQGLSGTSMACPHVAGALALLKSARPAYTWSDLKTTLLSNVDAVAGLETRVSTRGRLSAARPLIVSSGPYVTVPVVVPSDATAGGAVGNGDGILNPGEDIAVRITIRNAGSETASDLNTQVSVPSGASVASMLHGTHAWGSLASGSSATNTASPFLVRLAPGATTPASFALRFVTTDGAGNSWQADAEFTVFTSSTVSGRVVALSGATPIAGAVVSYTGPRSGNVTTGTDGSYSFAGINGSYVLNVSAGGYNRPDPVTVTVPPSLTEVNFALGRSRLQVHPTSLSSTQLEDQVVPKTLTVTNTGDIGLSVSLGVSVVPSASAGVAGFRLVPKTTSLRRPILSESEHASTPPAAPVSGFAGATTPLPFIDGFESGTLDGWYLDSGSGTREVVGNQAASGARSFHFLYNGPTAHFTGIHRNFAAGSRPRTVSFWVRTAQTNAASGYFVLMNGGFEAIWFLAKEDGKFYLNGDVGGSIDVPYQAQTWYHIEFRDIDWTTKTVAFHVNGGLQQANISFRTPYAIDAFSDAYLYNFSPNSEAWWDDVRVTTDSIHWLAVSPNTLTLAPGQSADVTASFTSVELEAGTYQASIDLLSNDPANPVTSVPASMTVQLAPNTPPVATPQTLVLVEDSSVTITLDGTDAESNPLTAAITRLPGVGTLYQTSDGIALGAPIASVPTTVSHAQRKVIYVPPPNDFGNPLATFDFVVKDRRSQSAPAVVSLKVTPVNDLPLAQNDFVSSLPGQVIPPIDVLANDSDADNDALSIQSFTQGARGSVAPGPNSTLIYTPEASFLQGEDRFTYTLTDGHGGQATATVSVAIGFLTAGPWPMYGHGPGHTSYYPALLGGQTLTPNWILTFDRALNPVSMADGKAFVTRSIYNNETYVQAVDLATGTLLWRRDFALASSLTGPSYHSGRIYLQRGNHSSDSQLWSLGARDGATVWSRPFAAQWEHYLPPTITSQAVYMNAGYYGGIYGIDRVTGSELFARGLPQVDGWTPTYGEDAVYSCLHGRLIKHHLQTGSELATLTFETNNYDAKVTAYSNGVIYIASSSGLYAMRVSTTPMSQIWKATGSFVGTPAVANGKVYALTSSKVQQFDATSGALLGEFAAGGQAYPIVTDDSLIVSSSSQTKVFALSDRALLQTIGFGGYLALSNGTLTIAGSDGNLRAYTVTGPQSHPPVATAKTVTAIEDTPLTIALSGTDVDGNLLSALITRLPTRGTLHQTSDGLQIGEPITTVPVLVRNPERKVIYRATPDGFGPAFTNFGFRVNDGTTNSAEATLTVDVTGVNDAPIAVADELHLRPGTTLESFQPEANDIDPDAETLFIVSFTQPAHGTVSQNADGTLRYVAQAGFEGTTSFDYIVRDGANVTSGSTVTFHINNGFGRAWPTFGGSPERLGAYPASLGTAPLAPRWSFNVGVTVNSLAVAEGRVFYTEAGSNGSSGNYVHAVAIDSLTGSEVWRRPLPPGTLNPPTYFKNTIYLQRGNSSDSQIWALDSSNGATRWQMPFGAQWERYLAPAVTDAGVFVNAGTYGGMYGFNPVTGAQKFAVALEQADQWTPALNGTGLYSLVGSNLRRHHPDTGATEWTVSLGAANNYQGRRTLALEGNRAYAINSGELLAVDLDSRTVLWRVAGSFNGTPAVSGGVVYGLAGGLVKAYGASSGQLLRQYSTTVSALTEAPIVTGDLVLASAAGKTFVFRLSTGALLQTLSFGGTMAVADDVLYLACSDFTVRAFGVAPIGNRTPLAQGAQVGILEEAEVAIQFEATDADGDALRMVIRTLPAQGTLYQTVDGTTRGDAIVRAPVLVQHPSGRVVYKAPLNVSGTNVGSFTFTASDFAATSAAATVRIDVTPVNDTPIAIADRYVIRPGQTLAGFRPEANDREPDGDVLTLTAFTQGSKGSVSQNGDGSLVYVPTATFLDGTDTFTYTVSDPFGLTASASVTIEVSATRGVEWPTFGGSPEHTGYVPVQLGTAAFTPRWAVNTGAPAYQTTIAGGRVFLTHQIYFGVGNFITLDSASGGELWRVAFNGGAYMNAPTAHGNDVIFQYSNSSSSRLYTLNAATGATRWSSPFAAQWEKYLAPAVDDTGVYVNGGTYGGIYGFNRISGAQKFFLGLEQEDDWTPTLYQGGLYSFVKGNFRSHHRDTGAILWNLSFGWNYAPILRTIACDSGRAFVVNDSVLIPAGDQELIGIDLAGRAVAWRVRGRFAGTPAVAHQTVYALAGGNSVAAYDQVTGALLGTYLASGETALQWQPIVTNDLLVAYSSTKTYVFHLQTRALLQTIPYGGYVSLADGTLYISSPDNFTRAFGVPTPSNQAPVAQALVQTTAEDVPVALSFTGTDANNDPLRFVITSLPVAGTLYQTADGLAAGAPILSFPTLVTNPDGKVIYVPPQDRHGTALGAFNFKASDGRTLSSEVLATIHVTPVNDAPVALADSRITRPGEILSPLRERQNDVDVDADPLAIVSFTQPPQGLVALNPDGTLRYHPPRGATSGAEEFSYTIQDPSGQRSSATVRVEIVSALRGSWPTLGNGPDHTGFTSASLARSNLSARWTHAGPPNPNQPAVADGNIYITANTTTSLAYALNEKTGAPVWNRSFANAFSTNPPTAFGGRIYFQRGNSSDTQLYALDGLTGLTNWSMPQAAQWENYLAPAVSDLGVFTNGGGYGGIYGHHPVSGTQKFFLGLEQYDNWTPTLDGLGGLYSFVMGKFRSHQPATGAVTWTLDLTWNWSGYDMARTSAVAAGRAYILNNGPSNPSPNELVAIRLDFGTVAWRVPIASANGTPAVADGTVYVLSGTTVLARSAADGRALQTFAATGSEPLLNQPIVTPELVVAAAASKTFVFDRYTAALLATLPRGGQIAITDDQLVVASADGTITAFAGPAAISFSPSGGSFPKAVPVTLTTSQTGGEIRYTLDGSAPDLQSAVVAPGGTVVVPWTGALRAIQVRGSAISRIHEAVFTITDADNDGLPDWWELNHFGNLTATNGSLDSDGDGATDRAEMLAGTNPNDPADFFRLTQFARNGAGYDFAWTAKPDRGYVVEWSAGLDVWTPLSEVLPGVVGTKQWTLPNASGAAGFFRVRATPTTTP